jgi:hypothetical protein
VDDTNAASAATQEDAVEAAKLGNDDITTAANLAMEEAEGKVQQASAALVTAVARSEHAQRRQELRRSALQASTARAEKAEAQASTFYPCSRPQF